MAVVAIYVAFPIREKIAENRTEFGLVDPGVEIGNHPGSDGPRAVV
jgi:hypothetical protein